MNKLYTSAIFTLLTMIAGAPVLDAADERHYAFELENRTDYELTVKTYLRPYYDTNLRSFGTSFKPANPYTETFEPGQRLRIFLVAEAENAPQTFYKDTEYARSTKRFLHIELLPDDKYDRCNVSLPEMPTCKILENRDDVPTFEILAEGNKDHISFHIM